MIRLYFKTNNEDICHHSATKFYSFWTTRPSSKKIKLTIQLMELHDENTFKIRSYQSALNSLERGDADIMELSEDELSKVPGVGKSILEAIKSLKESESFPQLDQLLEKTPQGILEILQIKGLGPKKVKTLWEELGITSTHELMEACQSGKVAKIKGFGEKNTRHDHSKPGIQSLQCRKMALCRY